MHARNLLIFGCDFFPSKKASEINFWNDMVSCLRERFEEVVILSVNNRKVRKESLYPNVHLYNVRPYYPDNRMRRKDPEYTGQKFHILPMATAYKTYSFWKYLPIFETLIDRHNIGIVHYMRVFGLLNRRLTGRHADVTFSITVPTHVDRGFPFHRPYHAIKNAALRPMDKIVATSRATRDRLRDLGIEEEKLEVIPWSTRDDSATPAPDDAARARAELDIPPGAEVILWSGPLQGTGPAEFSFALAVARAVAARTDRFLFIFAFKPDAMKAIAGEPAADSDMIRLLETDREMFSRLKGLASAFLSPVCNRNRTVAPPLTWIEMMQHGTPVITTPVAGADELISHGSTGFLVEDVAGTVDLLATLEPGALHRMEPECRRVASTRYDIRSIADRYSEMWTQCRG